MKYIKHQQLKDKLLKNPDFYRAYNHPDPAVAIGWRVKRMRLAQGLSQNALAKKLKTHQPSIARLESGRSGLPSLAFLKRVAEAMGADLVLPDFFAFSRSALSLEKTTSRKN